MGKFTIVGAGQAGLQLALGLLDDGHEVTVVSNRTADDIASGRVLSSQCMFDAALQHERDLGINDWEDGCPPVDGISFTVPGPEGGKAISWAARLHSKAQSVDQRVKVPGWMGRFEAAGGELVIHNAEIADLERYAAASDLVIVASGKGDIGRLFPRNAADSTYDQPMRALALTYVTGMTPRPDFSAVCFNLIPGLGEYFVFPALTTTGPCEIMVFEGVPGGPMDCWGDVKTPEDHLAKSKWILETFLPWEGERCQNVALTDDNGILAGRFAPTVREPVGILPSGAMVLGMGDTVVLNDPITGQGSNNASHCASTYLGCIRQRESGGFDGAWMQATFDQYWDYAKFVTQWTNAMLGPPPDHVLNLLGAANTRQGIADWFVNGFNDPRDYSPKLFDPEEAGRFIGSQPETA